jgi:hypothetical protein
MIRIVLSLLLVGAAGAAVGQPPSLDEVRRDLREGRVEEALSAVEQRLAVDATDR